jgi:uncharacterized protein (TIGR02265 family)
MAVVEVSSSLVPFEHNPDRPVDLDRVRAALALDERLQATPSWAQVRGFVFKMTSDAVERRGAAAVALHRRLSPARSRWFFLMYSAREYLEDLAAAAAVLSPGDPQAALRQIWGPATGYAPMFDASKFLVLLGTDVVGVVRWLEGHRHFFANYGRWRIEVLGERYFVMHYFDEYIWIDSAHRGGMEGLLEACGLRADIEADLDTPLSGRLHVRWRAR